ncbi:MAG TPA: HAD-IIIC family phosphatase [Clostridiales bacterium]|nr:HAD-IIIC family phosphatase [Clostridiales bacterium]
MKKLAILSNVNIDMIYKLLPSRENVFPPQGYGNAFSLMLDTNSDLAKFSPSVIFFIVDISALTENSYNYEEAASAIDEWFGHFRSCMQPDIQYFISDTLFRTTAIEDIDEMLHYRIGQYWMHCLAQLTENTTQVHRFPVQRLIDRVGTSSFFSEQLWYLGKIPFTAQGCKLIAEQIILQMELLIRVPKKVLVLDLDNTLWGGIVGELGALGIQLSNDKVGALYHDAQKIIKQMQKHGVILAINSKNNINDALEVIRNHPHMVLREEDFSALRINWQTKADNMQELALELNLSLDSFVFIDDMPTEREAIRTLFPMIEVPDFPTTPDNLPVFFEDIYYRYFQKLRMTEEDADKTKQYHENGRRIQLSKKLDFNTFLQDLQIGITREAYNNSSKRRLLQLLQKTNQFNLTTRRYGEEDLSRIEQDNWLVYLFRAADKFGDYGIIAAVLIDITKHLPNIDSFVMSCRIMGKLIENYIIDYVECDLLKRGYYKLTAEYIPTSKNIPVHELYDSLGYHKISSSSEKVIYEIDLALRPKRIYHVNNNLERI